MPPTVLYKAYSYGMEYMYKKSKVRFCCTEQEKHRQLINRYGTVLLPRMEEASFTDQMNVAYNVVDIAVFSSIIATNIGLASSRHLRSHGNTELHCIAST